MCTAIKTEQTTEELSAKITHYSYKRMVCRTLEQNVLIQPSVGYGLTTMADPWREDLGSVLSAKWLGGKSQSEEFPGHSHRSKVKIWERYAMRTFPNLLICPPLHTSALSRVKFRMTTDTYRVLLHTLLLAQAQAAGEVWHNTRRRVSHTCCTCIIIAFTSHNVAVVCLIHVLLSETDNNGEANWRLQTADSPRSMLVVHSFPSITSNA
jgi:hypothetical protein